MLNPATRTAPEKATPHNSGLLSAKILMLAATLARMGVGLLTFVLMARYLGPEPFGLIATAIAYTSFFGLGTDWGLGTFALRAAAAAPEQTALFMADALAVKALLTLVVLVLGGGALIAVMPADRLAIYALAFVGVLAYSAADLIVVAARANKRFDLEAWIVLATSAVMLIAVGGVAALTRSVLPVAIAFAATRVSYLALTVLLLRRWLASPLSRSRAQVRATMYASKSYAADNALTVLSTQIDVLLFGAMLSLHDMGIYQSGGRLVQVIMPFAVVLSTVYLPGLSASHAQHRLKDFGRDAAKLTWEFTALAALGGIGFAFVAPFLSDLIYGARYGALRPLWSGFAVFAVLRFTAAAYGLQLVALGMITPRLIAQIGSIACLTLASLLLVPRFGLQSTSWLLALSAFAAFALLGASLVRFGAARKHVIGSMAAAVLIAATLAIVGASI